ncbi:MAG: D-alanyl-D-alanine carboxypeptidase [Rickettsiaceae bacterium]|nr:D-alanyl-D-alanine carboxypeptidase [Rickettsiaceae bacterium]
MLKKYAVILLTIIILITNSAEAAKKGKRTKKTVKRPIETSLIVDSETGKILHAVNADTKIYPASLAKVMTVYLIFEKLQSGQLSLDQKFTVSKYASKAMPSKLYLKEGEQITVRNAILGLVVKSANDVSRTVAENIAGSGKRFSRLMTIRARQLGMKNTTFTNPSGWHDPRQKTTAIDLAKLSIAIKRDFPQYYAEFFHRNSFTYKGRAVRGHNKVSERYPGADGLKTGFTTPAGCNLITSATRKGRSLIGIVTGQRSAAIRDKKMVTLLDKHFGVKPTKFTKKKTTKKKHRKTKKRTRSNKRNIKT